MKRIFSSMHNAKMIGEIEVSSRQVYDVSSKNNKNKSIWNWIISVTSGSLLMNGFTLNWNINLIEEFRL